MKLAAALVAATLSVSAQAALVIDQNQPTLNGILNLSAIPVQSFTPSGNNVAGIGIVSATGATAGIQATISLWDALPGNQGATQLASGTLTFAGPSQWYDVFWAPVAVTPNATYYFRVNAQPEVFIGASFLNSYTTGSVANFPGLPDLDLTFRTYSEGSVAAIPEPAGWAMLIAGFGLIGAVARRKRMATA